MTAAFASGRLCTACFILDLVHARCSDFSDTVPCSTVAARIQNTMILLQRYEGQERGAHAETVMPADLVMRCGTQLSLYNNKHGLAGERAQDTPVFPLRRRNG